MKKLIKLIEHFLDKAEFHRGDIILHECELVDGLSLKDALTVALEEAKSESNVSNQNSVICALSVEEKHKSLVDSLNTVRLNSSLGTLELFATDEPKSPEGSILVKFNYPVYPYRDDNPPMVYEVYVILNGCLSVSKILTFSEDYGTGHPKQYSLLSCVKENLFIIGAISGALNTHFGNIDIVDMNVIM